MAFDIVLGQNDSDKLSALMHNRPPRRLKVVNHCNVTVLLIEVAYHKSFTMLRGGGGGGGGYFLARRFAGESIK